jgi:hypothetical protein
VAGLARIDERRARQAFRREIGAVRQLVNSVTTGRLRQEAVNDTDIAPTRHRHSAIWHAW